jgi:hypothetical protein
MRRFLLALAVLSACASTAAVPVQQKPPIGVTGESCEKDSDCGAGAQCIHVVGMQPQSARQECWISCDGNSDCPSGMYCEMIHDGPGQVCLEPED